MLKFQNYKVDKKNAFQYDYTLYLKDETMQQILGAGLFVEARRCNQEII